MGSSPSPTPASGLLCKIRIADFFASGWNNSSFSATFIRMKSELREIDLYPPLEKFLTHHGYLVHAEVVLSDISATKEGMLLVVEVKLRFNLDVILQALERQRAADAVYIAVPIRNFRRYPRRWKTIRALCSRLSIGILFVRFVDGRDPEVEVALPRKRSPDEPRKKNSSFCRKSNKGASIGTREVAPECPFSPHTERRPCGSPVA
jgi:hypothetical protein